MQFTEVHQGGIMIMAGSPVELRRLLAAIEMLRVLDDTMPVQMLAVLLQVALAEDSGEPMSLTQLAEALHMGQSSVSRNVATLSEWSWQKKPGLSLVETRIDLMELRRKNVGLTPKGRKLIEQLSNILGGRRA